MTKFSYIEPEVAGGFGERTRHDTSVFPPTVIELEYQFEGWLGGDLIESCPCFIATWRLRDAIVASQLTGVTFHDVIVSKECQFQSLHPEVELPPFNWMKIQGVAGEDDFGIAKDCRLVISRDAELVLRGFNLSDATFEEFP